MSRSRAKELINMEEYKNSMKDIYTTSVSESTIDEAPFAYKPMDEILKNQRRLHRIFTKNHKIVSTHPLTVLTLSDIT